MPESRPHECRPHVSVVVPVYDDAARLAFCLEALERQTLGRDLYEVIAVDNGSADDIEGVARRFPRVRLLREERPGAYAARNRGIEAARGEILAFTDADCIPAEDWIERGLEAFRSRADTGLVGGKVTLFARDPERLTPAEIHQRVRGGSQAFFVAEYHFAITANVFTSRQVLAQVGAFDERLKSGGDYEWGRRVHAKGLRLLYAEAAEVRHPSQHSLRALCRQRRRTTGGYFQFHALSGGSRWQSLLGTVDDYWPVLRDRWGHEHFRAHRGRGRFAAVELLLFAVTVVEAVRLSLGGEPRRS